jgi:CRP-like cAMP-binding protein
VVDVARIESVASLAALPPTVRADLAAAFEEVTVPLGEHVAKQGDFAYELFAIVEGTARVEQDGVVVARLGPGDLFGELGVLLTGRRTAAIVAETPMQLLVLFEQAFRRLSREHPDLGELVHAQSRGRFTRPAAV